MGVGVNRIGTPDFIINGADCRVVVEVKPIDNDRDHLFKESIFKIERSGWNNDALVLGRSLVEASTLSVGWLGQYFEEDRSWCWDVAPFQVVGDGCKAIAGFCHETQSYCDRISGCSPGGQTGVDLDTEARLLRLWKSAGNAVQWRSS